MAGILGELVGPAKLVAISIGNVPEQFKVEGGIDVGRYSFYSFHNCEKVPIEYPILAKNQGILQHTLGEWHYKNLTDVNVTTVNDKDLPMGGDRLMYNGDIIRILKDDQMMIFVFLNNFSGDMEWKRVLLSKEQKVYHIYSHSSEYHASEDKSNPEKTAPEKDAKNSDVLSDSSKETDTEKSGALTGSSQENHPAKNSTFSDSSQGEASEKTPDVTQHHAILRYTKGHWQVEDTDTTRGVFVNQNKINGTRVLNLYDVIYIGSTHFVFYGDYIAYNLETFRNNDLEIHIRERTVKSMFRRHVLLKDIDLRIEPGNMVLILGGSGAGKTTFINAVTGYEKAKATILQGDLDVYDDYEKMKYKIGMVPQQDLLRGDDTVIMTLSNAAAMRMPTTATAADRKDRVNELLRLFGLETVKGELVDKLSGGQRKRLSIAVEFVADPSIFILDEPDSGLDGVMARDLMKQLRGIADQNKIVMVITHIPDRVIDLFDKVIVLTKNSSQTGQLAFYGTIKEAREFFHKDTMEDIILTVNSTGEGGEGLADQYIEKFIKYREDQSITPPDTMENGVGVKTIEVQAEK